MAGQVPAYLLTASAGSLWRPTHRAIPRPTPNNTLQAIRRASLKVALDVKRLRLKPRQSPAAVPPPIQRPPPNPTRSRGMEPALHPTLPARRRICKLFCRPRFFFRLTLSPARALPRDCAANQPVHVCAPTSLPTPACIGLHMLASLP